ncbi:MAG: sigma-70 family RNA polymerase sigma factor [Acutalibacteraceae bacterium]|nr:sigma-70 family RNA polymerase sigma factor [Acutalibacteraceae bacterium]
MCNKELLAIAEEIKNKDMSHFKELYDNFGALIHHFEIKLGYDDAGQELTVFLLELIYSLNTDRFLPDDSEEFNRYIVASIRNKYIALSKKKSRIELESGELYDCLGCEEEFDVPLILKEGMKSLNSRQRSAIILRYIYGFSDTEIGERLGITRQAVNRLQRKSLNILREVLEK